MAPNMTTQYAAELLGVDPEEVTRETLRDTYRALLKDHHPDLGGAEESEVRDQYTRRLNSAYRWLSLYLDTRDERRRQAEIDKEWTDAGWTFEPVAPDWFPSEPPPGSDDWSWVPESKRKNPRKSEPTQTPTIYPSLGRQRSVLLLIGAVAILSGVPWYDALALMLTALILGSLLMGRPLEVLGDLLAPIERWIKQK